MSRMAVLLSPWSQARRPVKAQYPWHSAGFLARSERLRDEVIELRRRRGTCPPGQRSVIGKEDARSQRSVSHRVETSQLQLPGLCVRAQIDGVCGQMPLAEGGHVADPRIQKGHRPSMPAAVACSLA